MKNEVFAMQDYFNHHGIKGQKWGIRRYQNPDGTLTEEGKKRYYVNGDMKSSYTLRGFLNRNSLSRQYGESELQRNQRAMGKVAITVGSIIAAGTLLTIGSMKLDDYIDDEKKQKSNKSFARSIDYGKAIVLDASEYTVETIGKAGYVDW